MYLWKEKSVDENLFLRNKEMWVVLCVILCHLWFECLTPGMESLSPECSVLQCAGLSEFRSELLSPVLAWLGHELSQLDKMAHRKMLEVCSTLPSGECVTAPKQGRQQEERYNACVGWLVVCLLWYSSPWFPFFVLTHVAPCWGVRRVSSCSRRVSTESLGPQRGLLWHPIPLPLIDASDLSTGSGQGEGQLFHCIAGLYLLKLN